MPSTYSSSSLRVPRDARRALAVVGALGLCLGQLGCSSVNEGMSGITGLVTPYRVDVQQGNVVTREQAEALKPGMSRAQVRDMLGSPLLTSVFHADRWDYVFTFRRQGQALQERKVTLFFKGDVLDRVEADALPSESEFVSSLDAKRKTDKLPSLEASEEQLKAFAARNAVPATPAASAAAAATAPVAYPPLESSGAGR